MNQKLIKMITLILVIETAIFIVIFMSTTVLNKSNTRTSLKYFTQNHRRKPVTEGDVTYISQWMTFDYINNVFNLPDTYFIESIGIHDPKYPLLTIEQYARNKNINTNTLIKTIQEDVKSYIEQPAHK